MTDESSRRSALALSIVWNDGELFEVALHARAGDWSGAASAFTSDSELNLEARFLLEWSEHLQGDVVIEAGEDEWWLGSYRLRWYAVDRVGHVGCQIQISTRGPRSSDRWRINLEITTEVAAVERFARQVRAMAESGVGEAILTGD